jgi:hypothetical protein
MAIARRLRNVASQLASHGTAQGAASPGLTGDRPPASTAADDEPVSELSDRDKFMLDLQGFLVIPRAMSPDAVAAANAAIDAMWEGEYVDGGGATRPCRQGGVSGPEERYYSSLHGALEWPKPHCLPFRELLATPAVIPALNTLFGRGWRLDHSPWLICGDQSGVSASGFERNAYGSAGGGGTTHGHIWDPECRYHFANGQMRSGMVVVGWQLTDIEEGWGGFGVVPASHKAHIPLPNAIRLASTDGVVPPLVQPAMKAGDALLFMEACCHATLPWFGPRNGVGRRSALYRFAPRHMAVRSGRGYHWGGSWTYEVQQPGWVSETSAEAQEMLGPARASWASTPPTTPPGITVENSALKSLDSAADTTSGEEEQDKG